ncbi:MAG TPA: response regulator [Burkholderiaceae bacterium]|nr:response regulator [Burkholderiaceae bacterium]
MRSFAILYVEDNDDLRATIADLLGGPGRTVTACASSEEALVACETAPFDVVVTDVSLPGLSGTELARRLVEKNPAQWIVLCSGYKFDDQIAELGANVRSLPKPFEPEELDALMNDIIAAVRGHAD